MRDKLRQQECRPCLLRSPQRRLCVVPEWGGVAFAACARQFRARLPDSWPRRHQRLVRFRAWRIGTSRKTQGFEPVERRENNRSMQSLPLATSLAFSRGSRNRQGVNTCADEEAPVSVLWVVELLG